MPPPALAWAWASDADSDFRIWTRIPTLELGSPTCILDCRIAILFLEFGFEILGLDSGFGLGLGRVTWIPNLNLECYTSTWIPRLGLVF